MPAWSTYLTIYKVIIDLLPNTNFSTFMTFSILYLQRHIINKLLLLIMVDENMQALCTTVKMLS